MELILAPLAGYTDRAFREIAASFGADKSITEMVSAEGLARDGEKTKKLLERFDGEELIVQLFAPSADPVRRCMDILLPFRPAGIDINCGCPVPKVVKTGAGSALMQNPERIGEIVRTIKERTDIPVSVKFRLGWDSSSINFLEVAQIAKDAGAEALTLHARTRAQGYSGKADWNAFRTLSENIKGVKLYASGDIFTPENAAELLADYGMDGVMFARGAIGNPFIFRTTREYMETGHYTLPDRRERIETAIKHLSLAIDLYGENTACREMRKHLMAYIKGIEGANKAKLRISEAVTLQECEAALRSLL